MISSPSWRIIIIVKSPAVICVITGGDPEKDKEYKAPAKHCRWHHITTWPDDYCSDAMEVKHEN